MPEEAEGVAVAVADAGMGVVVRAVAEGRALMHPMDTTVRKCPLSR